MRYRSLTYQSLNISYTCASSGHCLAYRKLVVLHLTSWSSALCMCRLVFKDLRGPLFRVLQFFVCITLFSHILCPTNSSQLSLHRFLAPKSVGLRGFYLGSPSPLHQAAVWKLPLGKRPGRSPGSPYFVPFSGGSQTYAACCVLSENSYFLYFFQFPSRL